jgi:hypothetical protein
VVERFVELGRLQIAIADGTVDASNDQLHKRLQGLFLVSFDSVVFHNNFRVLRLDVVAEMKKLQEISNRTAAEVVASIGLSTIGDASTVAFAAASQSVKQYNEASAIAQRIREWHREFALCPSTTTNSTVI